VLKGGVYDFDVYYIAFDFVFINWTTLMTKLHISLAWL